MTLFATACKTTAIILLLLAAGCGFTPDLIVLVPDSPVLIVETKGKYVRLFAHQGSTNKMIEKGWVATKEYEGWTLTPFNWDAEIEARRGDTDAATNGSSSP